MYLVVEIYDGCRVRVLASARTEEGAERQLEREARIREKGGYCFFPTFRVVGPSRRAVGGMMEREVEALPGWGTEAGGAA